MKLEFLIPFQHKMEGNFLPFGEKHLLPMGLEMTQEEKRLLRLLEEEAKERLRRKNLLSCLVELKKIQKKIQTSLFKRRRRKEIVNN